MRVVSQVVQKFLRVLRDRNVVVFAGYFRHDGILPFLRADNARDVRFARLYKNLLRPVGYAFHEMLQRASFPVIRDFCFGRIQNRRRDVNNTRKLRNFAAVHKLRPPRDKRYAYRIFVPGALVLTVARAEMRAVIGGVDDYCVVVNTLCLQAVHEPAEVLVKACAAAEIVGVVLAPVAFRTYQIPRNLVVFESLLRAVGTFVTVVVVLMVRLEIRKHEEKRLIKLTCVDVIDCVVRKPVDAVACKIHAVHIPVEHEAVVAVRRGLERVGRQPVVVVAAAVFRRHGLVAKRNALAYFGREMPFADVADLVTGVLQMMRKKLASLWQRHRVAVDFVLRRVQSGLQTCPRGAAHRLTRKPVLKQRTLRGQSVKVRRNVQLLPVRADRIPALLVAEKKYNVRLLSHFAILPYYSYKAVAFSVVRGRCAFVFLEHSGKMQWVVITHRAGDIRYGQACVFQHFASLFDFELDENSLRAAV